MANLTSYLSDTSSLMSMMPPLHIVGLILEFHKALYNDPFILLILS